MAASLHVLCVDDKGDGKENCTLPPVAGDRPLGIYGRRASTCGVRLHMAPSTLQLYSKPQPQSKSEFKLYVLLHPAHTTSFKLQNFTPCLTLKGTGMYLFPHILPSQAMRTHGKKQTHMHSGQPGNFQGYSWLLRTLPVSVSGSFHRLTVC